MSDYIELIKWGVPILGTALAWYINERQKRNLHKWELKKKACLDALEIVDAYYSHQNWTTSEGALEAEKQEPPLIKDVRNTYNNLSLCCDQVEVLSLYKKCLGVYGNTQPDDMVDLRNAIRKELGYGKEIDRDRDKAWIARVNSLNQQ